MTSILLVEDKPTLRQLVSEVLEFSGYQVTVRSIEKPNSAFQPALQMLE